MIKTGYDLPALKGPAIIAANHPNSMMDAALIGCLCSYPVHFTIRSDMFKNKLFRFLLHFLNGVPIYRISEDKEKLRDNFASFEACRKVLMRNGIVLIFSEGVTLQDWELKPLKSGTYRMVAHVLQDEYLRQKLQVVPVGLTYSSYTGLAKTVIVQAAAPFYPGVLLQAHLFTHPKQAFNEQLYSLLLPLIPRMTAAARSNTLLWQALLTNIHITHDMQAPLRQLNYQGNLLSHHTLKNDRVIQSEPYYVSRNKQSLRADWLVCLLLFIPAIAGAVLNAGYYLPVTGWCRKKTAGSIFYDSLLLGITTITYPLFILLLSVILQLYTPIAGWIWVLIIPLAGWCLLELQVRAACIRHYSAGKKMSVILESLEAEAGKAGQ